MQTKPSKHAYHLVTEHKRMLADTITPVNIYLKIRDRYDNPILLESSDYHSSDNSFSFICCSPIATFSVKNKVVRQKFPDGTFIETKTERKQDVIEMLSQFAASFKSEEHGYKFSTNGMFGYMAYDAVQYYEDIDMEPDTEKDYKIPEIHYAVYRYVIAIDHFRNELFAFHHEASGEEAKHDKLSDLISLINNRNIPNYRFQRQGDESSNYSDEEFLDIIRKGQEHCFRGDVFQIVLSRRFQNHFKGDEFNVYRALRSINPSPYLFYFDYGYYKIFGSSPEAQIVIKGGEASIYPIAGTFKRTGNDIADAELAKKLLDDPKENSEHVMLVDLARNDLSRHGNEVTVETFKEVQYFSHVIHLVSKVTSKLAPETSPIQVVADTFPAGTLSGAPKHMAMQLINKYESTKRGYYGGAIGFLGFGSDQQTAQFNHAIMIRSFISQHNTLYYQAGAGVVAKSVVESELQEVNNKLAALRRALEVAEGIAN
ncbi:anthranilate synthase component I family protein [Catalinimonas niigatensis]|uniref:anthranilate synthase component I family protein n=1 Tax=Catalinimonas niigatensis TaxID=1397264 RepID=UPI002665F946|nr:anthranilate synthase component I family protein [Catalinimonas niigatensis]WPP48996.1 anthranilate synthase component I family protein [Catalinimonas niigatensis]